MKQKLHVIASSVTRNPFVKYVLLAYLTSSYALSLNTFVFEADARPRCITLKIRFDGRSGRRPRYTAGAREKSAGGTDRFQRT
eukprot:3933129-Pleurochrysis_carterae.AAC.1